MRGFILGVAAVLAASTGTPANAQQRCQEVIQRWSSTPMEWRSQNARADARDEIEAAQDELRRGNNDRCLRHMDRALRIAQDDRAADRGDRRYSDRRSDDRYDDRDRRTEGSGGGLEDLLRSLGR